MSKKNTKKTQTKMPVKNKPIKKKPNWKGEEATFSSSVSLKSLSIEDQKMIGYSSGPYQSARLLNDPEEIAKESKPDYQGLKTSDFEAALRSTGQMTDEELLENKHKFQPFDADKFTEVVENDTIPFEEMMTYIASLFVGSTDTKSFDVIVSKFFNFHLRKMDLKELIILKYRVEQLINKQAIGSEEKENVNYKIG
jgi:hypothetical protein